MLFGMATCKETLQRMNGYLDRTLTPEDERIVRRHVKICHACAIKFAEEERLLAETRASIERIASSDAMVARMSDILRQTQQFKEGA